MTPEDRASRRAWEGVSWQQCQECLAGQGVDVVALLTAWGITVEGPVLLTEEREAWVEGVLAGEIEPRPILEGR